MYLKTVYACISKEVIKPAYWTLPTTTTVSTTTPTTTTTTTADRTTENDSGVQSFDRSYIIASSLDEDERRMKDEAESDKKKKTNKEEKGGKGGGEVTVAKAKDQEELDKQANLVYGFVSNFFSSYKHISENQVRFFPFLPCKIVPIAQMPFFVDNHLFWPKNCFKSCRQMSEILLT